MRSAWSRVVPAMVPLLFAIAACAPAQPSAPTVSTGAPTGVSVAPTKAPTVAVPIVATTQPASTMATIAPVAAPTVAAAVPTSAPTTAVATMAPTSAPTAAPAADVKQGIVFGKPVVFRLGGFATVGVLATNTTDQAASFTVKATFKNGDKIAATAVGAVNALAPGQKRAVTLVTGDPIPESYDSAKVDVDTMLGSINANQAAAAPKITFGAPKVTKNGPITTVAVEATNSDSAPHSFTVSAAFLQGEELVGIGTGAINDLGAGQTKTATLIVQGSGDGDPAVAVDTLVR
jgi:hypothetical protein